MKKLLVILICGALSLTLTACGNKNTPAAGIAAGSLRADEYKEPTAGGTAGNNGNNGGYVGDNGGSVGNTGGRDGHIDPDDYDFGDDFYANFESGVQGDYDLEEEAGGVSIEKYHGEGGKLLIPSKINGKTVVKINRSAFRGTAVTNVTVPSTVRTIEGHAFSGCDSLELLTLSEGVEVIDGYAFSYCTKLTLVTLPDSVYEINNGAFAGCPNIMVSYKGNTYNAANIRELYDFF